MLNYDSKYSFKAFSLFVEFDLPTTPTSELLFLYNLMIHFEYFPTTILTYCTFK